MQTQLSKLGKISGVTTERIEMKTLSATTRNYRIAQATIFNIL